MTKYYAMKHALGDGKIQAFEGQMSEVSKEIVYSGTPGTWQALYYKIGKEAFTSLDDAVAAANSARAKKIASLRKQIAKLEAMTFEVSQ